jgi:hypothetical protein
MPPRISSASPQTFRASRVERNFNTGVRMRKSVAASWLPSRSARSSAVAVWKHSESACSTGSMIFSSCRFASGRSMMRLPNTTRPRATVNASCRARRISAVDFTPFDSRDQFTISAICRKPRSSEPTA